MPTRESLAAIGAARGRWLVRQFADELRHARLSAGLSQARVGAAAGISQRSVSRIETGQPPHPNLATAARVARVVGLDLRIQCYPAGTRLRDAAHVALIHRFLARLPASVRRRLEAPVAAADPRAWDVLLEMGGVRVGVIAETRIHDLQDLLRREHRKQLDGGVDHLLLLASDTRHNRRVADEAAAALLEAFPLRTRAVLRSLTAEEPLAENGIVFL